MRTHEMNRIANLAHSFATRLRISLLEFLMKCDAGQDEVVRDKVKVYKKVSSLF